MKIGIMSMQRIVNYGSFLQAYALKSTLEGISPDNEVVFVDYHPGVPLSTVSGIECNRESRFLRLLKVLFSPKYRNKRNAEIDQNKAFELFYSRFKNEWLPLLGIDDNYHYNTELDLLVIGSDEVFNCTQANREVGYSPELFGANNKSDKLITYAASFGSTTSELLDEHHVRDEVAAYLKEFDSISVRDRNSFEIVKQLTGKEPLMHVDPVLIYDFDFLIPDKVDLSDYIIVYAYSGRISMEEAKAIQETAHRLGKKTLSIGVKQSFTDEYRCVDPFTMLAYFKNADYVVTDTFHGTVFSIKYQIPFAVFIRESNKEKISDLLRKFDLENRAVEDENDVGATLIVQLEKELVKKSIEKYQTDSLYYLSKP